MNLAIYGAQGYALGTHFAIKALYEGRAASFFIVTNLGHNAPLLDGLPVREISDVAKELIEEEKNHLEVLIATPEGVQPEIEETLERYGFHHHRRVDSVRWAELMQLFHRRLGRFLPLSALPVGSDQPLLHMYLAKSHKDRPLKDSPMLPAYVHPLQVGASNTDRRIASLTDRQGENISSKNGNYSELTGLYWIWRNKLCADGEPEGVNKRYTDSGPKRGTPLDTDISLESDQEPYFGLSQYRRLLSLSSDDLLRLSANDVDVVLPYPLPYEPNIHAHHERYLKEADWQALCRALEELQPAYAAAFPEILRQHYLYNYNVILAKKSVLRDYCEWLFPILERTEALSVPKGSERADRYIGYMGETLETLYFMNNEKQLTIAHTACRLYT